MRVLLTGATGFIGKPALRQLLEQGHEVLSLSRATKAPVLTSIGGVLRWHPCDLALPATWRGEVSAFRPEAFLHLAWEGIPDYGLERSLGNLAMGSRLIETAVKEGCGRVVVSGSCWEYGKVQGVISEEIRPVTPGVFAAAKQGLHALASAICREGGASLAWGRVFYPYGPAQKEASLLPTVCKAIIENRDPELRTPSAANDFLYVDDTAAALAFLLNAGAEGTFNIGSGKATPVGWMADQLLLLAGKEPCFHVSPETAGNGFWADDTRLASLGWKPSTSLEEGLRRTKEFFIGP